MNQQDQTFYNILLRIEGKLGGIENELKSHKEIHADIKKVMEDKDRTIEKHDGRIEGLETFRTNVKAKVAAISGVASILVSIGFLAIKKLIDNFI